MLKKVTITNVKVAESKFGSDEKYTFKKGKNIGKNFVMVSIQTKETEDEYYSSPAIPGSSKATIKEGDTLILRLTESQSADDQKTFKNFDYPTKAEEEVYNQALLDAVNNI